MNRELFLRLEQANQDSIDVKRIYIDMADDLVAGVVLSQIVYWNLPDKKSNRPRLRVFKDGKFWLAKKREDWYSECRVTPKQVDRALKILTEKGLITVKVYKFDGSPTHHIRILWDNFLQLYQSLLTDRENGFLPKVKNQFDERVKSITENTTKNTTERDIRFSSKNTLELDSDFVSASKVESVPALTDISSFVAYPGSVSKRGGTLSDKPKSPSQTGLNPCTPLELWEIGMRMNVHPKYIVEKHTQIMELIESGEFQEKYKKNKTVYSTIQNWVRMDLRKGYIDEMDEIERMDAEGEHPDYKAEVKRLRELAIKEGWL